MGKLTAGEPFEKVADEYNLGELREMKIIGPSVRGSGTVPELEPWLFDQLSVGEFSSVVPTASRGYCIVKLVEKIEEHAMTFDEARGAIAELLDTQEQDRVFNEWLEAKREELGVKVFPEVLDLLDEGAETT
jgi:hypothetical protein